MKALLDLGSHQALVEPKPTGPRNTIYYGFVRYSDSGNYIEMLDWQVEGRSTEEATKKFLLQMSENPAWRDEIDNIEIACVCHKNLTWRKGMVEQRPARLVIK